MHKLLAKQIDKATTREGFDVGHLLELVSSVYEHGDRDRARTDRAISLMIEENDQLTRQLRETIASLAVQNDRFSAALDNMIQGLAMFDANELLVVANARFWELLGLPVSLRETGTSMSEMTLYATRAAGGSPRELRAFVAKAQQAGEEGKAYRHTFQTAQDNILKLLFTPTCEGGWLVVCEDVTEQKRAEARIRHVARHDCLTDLPNRTQFYDSLDRFLTTLDEADPIAIMSLDLDRFKWVNDSLGHPAGDALLVEVARRLRATAGPEDVIARLGGDEFAIIQVGKAQPAGAVDLADDLLQALGEPFRIEGQSVSIGASIGVTIAPQDGGSSNKLLKNADMALYLAKDEGRSGVCFYEPRLDALMQARRKLEADLRLALARDELEVHYQPLVDLSCNTITSFEALVRWNHPERGQVGPNEFIPVAEEVGLICAIGEWVLKRACADAATWSEDVKIAVNLSPEQFRDGSLPQVVFDALDEAGLEPTRLELEITESVMLQDTSNTMEILCELRTRGIGIAVDDFGTGYSSLSYLRQFPFDKVKIDQSFIRAMTSDKDALAIVRAVTSLSQSLGMVTVAEGVETQEQLAMLRAEHCGAAQGYLFFKPCDAETARRLLAAPGPGGLLGDRARRKGSSRRRAG